MRVLLAGKLQHDNFGDVIMAAYYMKNKSDDYYIYNSNSDVLSRLEELGCNASLVTPDEVGKYSFDLCVFIGGGYFGHTYLNGFSWCDKWENQNRLYHLASHLVSQGIPYIVQSVEVGPIYSRTLKERIKYILHNAESVSVRNEGSKQYCDKKLNLKVNQLGDIVYHETPNTFLNITSTSKRENLLIHITDKYTRSNLVKKIFFDKVVDYIKESHSDYKEVVLITDNEITTDLSEPVKLLSCIFNEKLINHKLIRYSDESLPNVINEISKSKKIITTKLHLGVLAKSYGSDVICFSDAPKSYRFYKDNNSLNQIHPFYFRFLLNFNKVLKSAFYGRALQTKPVKGIYLNIYDEFKNHTI